MKIYRKAILPLGFKANAVACGIKKKGKLDLALFYSEQTAKASCQFTTNKIQAAPVLISKKHLKGNNKYKAIIVNSGNANCFTAEAGLRDAEEITSSVAGFLGVKNNNVLAASTGIIARRLPVDKIKKALPGLVRGLSCGSINKAKKAIITTDKFTKEITAKFSIAGKTVTICGIAKGAGMIAPNLACPERSRGATMLCFVFTDADIAQGAFNQALKASVGVSFNCITVDGCMSTNDSVMAMANGAAKNAQINKGASFNLFTRALELVCLELAKMIVRDAEGASKFIRIRVGRAKTHLEAKKAALSIANSNLFKTAIYGRNPNFGRIVAAVGACGIEVKEKYIKIRVSSLDKKDINVDVSIGRGSQLAVVYTSDLTPEYIRINAEYN